MEILFPRLKAEKFCEALLVLSFSSVVSASRLIMFTWRTCIRTTIMVSVCALWATLTCVVSYAQATEEHPAHGQLSDVVDVVDEMTGTVPTGEESHAIDYQKPPLKLEWPLFLFSLVLFTGFVLIMRTTAWDPIIQGLNAREGRIVKAEAEARAARIEVEQLTAKAEQRMAEVYSEVKSIVAQARATAEAQKLEIVAQAEAEAQRIKREALAAIAQARATALAELEQTVEQQVELATEHVAGRRL